MNAEFLGGEPPYELKIIMQVCWFNLLNHNNYALPRVINPRIYQLRIAKRYVVHRLDF